jgi:ferredoxin
MAMRVDTTVLKDMGRFGAFDINACFNCGNCTAVCPLSEESIAFPRRVIRYAQLGQKDNIVASRELWLCYYCAECSDTCPRQAEPGEFMASARRFAIAGFDPTSIARRLYSSKAFVAGFLTIVFAALVAILLATTPGWHDVSIGRVNSGALLKFVPFETIHWLGVGVVVVMVVAAAATLINMFWSISRSPAPGAKNVPKVRPELFPLHDVLNSLKTAVVEIVGQKRYRDCDKEKPEPPAPLVLRRWFVHYSIMGGMVGLGLATVLDYLIKTPGSYVPIWYPIRLLGTVAGAFFVYGTTVAIVQRLRKPDKYYSHTLLSDWLFLGFLWAIGLTGFILELADYTAFGSWVGVVFLIHIALAMELIILLPFTKFAHIVYRPAAIWFTEFRRVRSVTS